MQNAAVAFQQAQGLGVVPSEVEFKRLLDESRRNPSLYSYISNVSYSSGHTLDALPGSDRSLALGH